MLAVCSKTSIQRLACAWSIGLLACSSAPQSVLDVATNCPPPTTNIAPDTSAPSTFEECAAFLAPHEPHAAVSDSPIGWASVSDLGQSGTTGGLGGERVLARTAQELSTLGARPEPLIIEVCGLLGTGPEEITIGSNKTLFGVGQRPTLRGNLDLDGVANVIIRNLTIEGADPDGIGMRRSHHVWVDHVDISDSADGNLDVTNESNYVTISFSKFWYRATSQPHRFSNLIGSGDEHLEDEGLLKVTMHHNWWAENVHERMPRARYGDIHLFNNYYSSPGDNYCIHAGWHARLLVEGNYFDSVADPIIRTGGGNVLERANIFHGTTGARAPTGMAFEPPYTYDLNAECEIPALVTDNAGARLNR